MKCRSDQPTSTAKILSYPSPFTAQLDLAHDPMFPILRVTETSPSIAMTRPSPWSTRSRLDPTVGLRGAKQLETRLTTRAPCSSAQPASRIAQRQPRRLSCPTTATGTRAMRLTALTSSSRLLMTAATTPRIMMCSFTASATYKESLRRLKGFPCDSKGRDDVCVRRPPRRTPGLHLVE
jgi:hypothetical protein